MFLKRLIAVGKAVMCTSPTPAFNAPSSSVMCSSSSNLVFVPCLLSHLRRSHNHPSRFLQTCCVRAAFWIHSSRHFRGRRKRRKARRSVAGSAAMGRRVFLSLKTCVAAGILLGRIHASVPQWEFQETWEGYLYLSASIPETCKGECHAMMSKVEMVHERRTVRMIWTGQLQPDHVFQTVDMVNTSVITVHVGCNAHTCFSVPTSAIILPGQRINYFQIFSRQELWVDEEEAPFVNETATTGDSSLSSMLQQRTRNMERFFLKILLLCIRVAAFGLRLKVASQNQKTSSKDESRALLNLTKFLHRKDGMRSRSCLG